MGFLWTLVSLGFSLLLTPFLLFVAAIVLLASVGKSLGVRRLYVNVLLRIFEYGRQHIEIAKNNLRRDSCDNSEEDEIDDGPATASLARKPASDTNSNDVKKLANGKLKNGVLANSVISREDMILVPDPVLNYSNNVNHEDAHRDSTVNQSLPRRLSFETLKREFELADCLEYVKTGVEAIIEDQVTLRFEAEELKSWNLLTRTNHGYEFISWRVTVIWMIGFLVRYFFLLPLRVLICFIGVTWLATSMGMVAILPNWLGPVKRWLNYRAYVTSFRVLARSVTAEITVHNKENRPYGGGVCVANHTTPIDVMVLSTENCFALIGQRHGGFLGILQRALARASPHIWFERSEVKDREAVTKRLQEHVLDPKNPPILIFPEGTCINNTSVMQFKKGSFEVGSVIYPVAIKYDPRFGDAFWNSSRFSMLQYLYMMMTSWAIVCDVWYLPPMYQKEGETAIDFANRVKSVIARQGGLVDLMWDGQLKRMKPKKEWKEKQQEEFSKRLKVD